MPQLYLGVCGVDFRLSVRFPSKKRGIGLVFW